MKIKIKALAGAITLGLGMMAGGQAHAANWLMLQGTEPPAASDRVKIWGFIQPEYQATDGSLLEAGPWQDQDAQFNLIGPDLDTSETFNIRRARIGARGTGFPLDSNVNYFFLAEFGNNGITRPGGGTGSGKLTDASVTFNHINGARVRVGQFKYPGSEEGLQAIHVFDYINFTNVTNQMMLERFFDYDGTGTTVIPGAPPTFINSGNANAPNGSVGAFRDVGAQVFDTFKRGDWEHSYAVMYGNGNGIARGDNNDEKDLHLYWSSELVFGGKGGRREGWKLYAWHQEGKRTVTLEGGDADPTNDVTDEFERERYGVGSTYRKGKYRAGFEYIVADGMIFNGTDGGAVVGSASNNGATIASFNVVPEGEADGWYVDFGYKVAPKWELDARYDVLNRLTDSDSGERSFETLTLGAQYFFNKKTRLIMNYEFRDLEAPNLASTANPNLIGDSMDDRLSLQILAVF